MCTVQECVLNSAVGRDNCDRKKDRSNIDGKAGVVKEGVEHDSKTLATGDNAEAVEEANEKHGWSSRECSNQIYKDCKDKAGDYFKWYLARRILHEESLNRICPVIMFAVKDVALTWIDSHILKHADEVERAELLDNPSLFWTL